MILMMIYQCTWWYHCLNSSAPISSSHQSRDCNLPPSPNFRLGPPLLHLVLLHPPPNKDVRTRRPLPFPAHTHKTPSSTKGALTPHDRCVRTDDMERVGCIMEYWKSDRCRPLVTLHHSQTKRGLTNGTNRESMEPAFQRGDLLILANPKTPIRVGDITVFKLEGRPIPIVHRVMTIHEQ